LQGKVLDPLSGYSARMHKQVVDHVREAHPKDFVRVSVITKEFSLKVSRRPLGKDLPWYDYPDLLRLPNEALDVNARKAPVNFQFENVLSPLRTAGVYGSLS
jgi:hypothetical protein